MMKKLLLLLLCCVLLLTACAFASAEVSLTSINVGKADCHLLTLGEQVFMVDTGSAESWGMVSRALRILGIDHLNGVILTHTDKDHAGGMQALAQPYSMASSSTVRISAKVASCRNRVWSTWDRISLSCIKHSSVFYFCASCVAMAF